MELKEIREIVAILEKSNLNELKIKKDEFEIHLVKSAAVEIQTVQAPLQNYASQPQNYQAAPAPVQSPVAKPEVEQGGNYKEIKSPMVGMFYLTSSPESPPYVKVGDVISPDSVIGVIEAMKLFNEIKAEIKGKIVKILVNSGDPVEYGQTLFLVE